MRNITTVILFLLLCSSVRSQENKTYFFEHLSIEDGLSQISVTAIFQDSKRYLWFGTIDGLNRYNGNEFEIYRCDLGNPASISDSYIRCIREDHKNHLWIGTTNGLNRMDGTTGIFKRYYIESQKPLFYQNEINCILIGPDGEIWVGTYNGLFKLDKQSDQLVKVKIDADRVYSIESVDGKLLLGTKDGLLMYNIKNEKTEKYHPFPGGNTDGNNVIGVIFKDSKNQVWLGSRKKGAGLFNMKTRKLDAFYSLENKMLSNGDVKDIKEDYSGNLLIGTHDGLNVLNQRTGQIKIYNQNDNERGNLSHYSVESIYCDNAKTIWVGTYSGGINYYHEQNGRFRFYDPSVNIKRMGVIGPIQEDKNGLWIGTDGGLIYLDHKSQQFQKYIPDNYQQSFKDLNVKCLLLKNEYLYCGVYVGWLYKFDVNKRKYVGQIFNDGGAIYSIIENTAGDFIVGTYSRNGLNILKNNTLNPYSLPLSSGKSLSVAQISCLLEDGANNLFIGTRANGLFHYHDRQVDKYGLDDNQHNVSGNKMTALFKDSIGRIWIGTLDGGLTVWNRKDNVFKTLTKKDGLKDDKICSITQDHDKRMWVVTRTGISEVDNSISVIKTYDYSSGIKVLEFTQNSVLTAADNTIYVGGNNGLIAFNPKDLKPNDFIPPIVIDNIFINNEAISFKQTNPIELNLKYDEANIAIEYSALNYIYPKQNKYAYQLEGVDRDWVHVGNTRKVNYANLQPGTYIFRVKGSNNDDVWNEEGCTIQIKIARPFWLSAWAYIFYFIVLFVIVYATIHYYKVRNNLKNEVLLKQKQEEFHHARINLFTNFSHELRTPLSLIIGPLEDVLEKSDLSYTIRNSLNLMHKNALRMLSLVNELMDFRKKESGSLALQVAAGDFGGFTEEIVIAFNELAKNREVALRYEDKTNHQQVWYDRHLFEKVLLNLLSNAFKHTPAQGAINVTLYPISEKEKDILLHDKKQTTLSPAAKQYLKLEIEDTGSGINKDELERIFDPFYQSPQNKMASLNSSGIGLSLSKGIVEMHRGAIWASSIVRKGSVFHIVIPLGKEHFTSEEIIKDYKDSENIKRYTSATEIDVENQDCELPEEYKKKFTILVVEDNKELRHYIKQNITKYYKVLESENGKDAYHMAVHHVPDLIISDIMMPEMDGLQMCRQLKEDIRTCHIPVILLTARSSVLQIKEGLEFGADDYITKPFNTTILLLKVKNIMMSRENLKNLYGKGFALENMGVEIISTEDRFLQKLCEVVEKNIAEPNLNIEKFCDEIGMSRANLYRRVKAVTNMSPLEYVKTIRLQIAAKMLKETDLSVSEISSKVGFSSLIHFSASFRKYYGLPPTKFALQAKREIS